MGSEAPKNIEAEIDVLNQHIAALEQKKRDQLEIIDRAQAEIRSAEDEIQDCKDDIARLSIGGK